MNKIYSFVLIVLLVLLSVTGYIDKSIVLLLFLYCLYEGKNDKHWFSPFYILLITFGSYLAYFSFISPVFLSTLQVETIILIISCFLMLILGFKGAKELKITPVKVEGGTENFWNVFIIGLLPTLVAYLLYGNVYDMEGDELLETKGKMSIPILGQFVYFLPASIIIACKKNRSSLIIISFVVSMLAALLTVTKTGLIIAALFALLGLTKYTPSILRNKIVGYFKATYVIWIPIVIFTFFSFNNNLRQEAQTGDEEMNYLEQGTLGSSKITATSMVENVFLDYLYLCAPWSNLDYNLNNNNRKSYGANTFSQFGKKIGLPFKKAHKMNPYFLNTHSFITDYYLDFGYVGAIIASFILGFFIYFCYMKFGLSDDPLLISFYCLIMYATSMLFFSNHFNDGYLLNYFITFGLYFIISNSFRHSSSRRYKYSLRK